MMHRSQRYCRSKSMLVGLCFGVLFCFFCSSQPIVQAQNKILTRDFAPEAKDGPEDIYYFRTIWSTPTSEIWVTADDKYGHGTLLAPNLNTPKIDFPKDFGSIADLSVVDLDNAWVIVTGQLLKLKHNFTSWSIVKPGLDELVRRIYFVNRKLGFALCESGSIYRTSNGGLTWQAQNVGRGFKFNEIQFIDSSHGWITGFGVDYTSYLLLRTDDGGQSWRSLAAPSVIGPDAFSFVNKLEGWAIDAQNNITHSRDGGVTWTVQLRASSDHWYSIYFINDHEGWIGGSGILHTADGGVTWNRQAIPFEPGSSNPITKLLFTDAQTGWALEQYNIYRTTDGGNQWMRIPKVWKSASTAHP